MKERITENRIDYVLVGDYYIPDLKLKNLTSVLASGNGCVESIYDRSILYSFLIWC